MENPDLVFQETGSSPTHSRFNRVPSGDTLRQDVVSSDMYFYIIVLFPLTAILQFIIFYSFRIFSLLINTLILPLNCLVLILYLYILFFLLNVIFLIKHYLDFCVTDTALKVSDLCTVSLLLYLMVLKTIFQSCWIRASLIAIFHD